MNLRLKLIGILLTLNALNAAAQVAKLKEERTSLVYPTPVSYRSGFLNFFHKNPDSALFYARKLAEKPEYASFLRQALHSESEYYFYFLEKTKMAFKEKALKNNEPGWEESYETFLAPLSGTLSKLYADADPRLSQSAEALYLYSEVQRHSADHERLNSLTRNFINNALPRKDLYQNATATYGLLIYNRLQKEGKFNSLSDELLSALIKRLSEEEITINIKTSPDSLLRERAWYRYVYACANRFKAQKLAKSGDIKGAILYFKTAAESSPDLTDLSNNDVFESERELFTGGKRSIFYVEYLEYLNAVGGDKNVYLGALCDAALRDPSAFKDRLEAFYTANFPRNEDFDRFWNKSINANFENAPTYDIETLDSTSYSSSNRSGKWILIDFWGTWCFPCREEHPDLQKFYRNSQANFAGKIELLTVACRDTEEKVNSYMKEFKYFFPVAMGDDKIIKLFNIRGYPTKALITPEGKYLFIPFNTDWVDFVKKYASL